MRTYLRDFTDQLGWYATIAGPWLILGAAVGYTRSWLIAAELVGGVLAGAAWSATDRLRRARRAAAYAEDHHPDHRRPPDRIIKGRAGRWHLIAQHGHPPDDPPQP